MGTAPSSAMKPGWWKIGCGRPGVAMPTAICVAGMCCAKNAKSSAPMHGSGPRSTASLPSNSRHVSSARRVSASSWTNAGQPRV